MGGFRGGVLELGGVGGKGDGVEAGEGKGEGRGRVEGVSRMEGGFPSWIPYSYEKRRGAHVGLESTPKSAILQIQLGACSKHSCLRHVIGVYPIASTPHDHQT